MRYQVVIWDLDLDEACQVCSEHDRKPQAMQQAKSQAWMQWFQNESRYKVGLIDTETGELWLHYRPGQLRKKLS